jgi:hypothetical protein
VPDKRITTVPQITISFTQNTWDSGRFLLMGLITPAHERMPARYPVTQLLF